MRKSALLFNDGDVIMIDGTRFRIISHEDQEEGTLLRLINMDDNYFNIIIEKENNLYRMLETGKLTDAGDEGTIISPDLKPGDKELADIRFKNISRFVKLLYPAYEVLQIKGIKKEQMTDLADAVGLSVRNTRKYVLRYLQQGGNYCSCIDGRLVARAAGTYDGMKGKVRGPKRNGVSNTVENDETLLARFKEAFDAYTKDLNSLQYAKGTKNKPSLKSYFDAMELKYYTCINENGKKIFLPDDQRPTYKRFYLYARRELGGKKIRKNAGAMDRYNNDRILKGNSLYGIIHPGELVEIDAHEMPIYLRSAGEGRQDQVIGKPVLYIAIDVVSFRVVGMHVHIYVNNSYEGFLNLVDSMLMTDEENAKMNKEVCGVPVFPGPMIPDEIRTDQGSEYTSKAIKENLTGGAEKYALEGVPVTLNLAPPGTGSMKGLVERIFNDIDSQLQAAAKNRNGYVNRTHNSKHIKEATLDIFEIRRIIYRYIATYNNAPVVDYPVTLEMKEVRTDWTPVEIWDYFADIYGTGFDCSDEEMRRTVRYGLMKNDKVFRLSQKQISYSDFLYYDLDDDNELVIQARRLASEKKTEVISIRYDPRSVERIYRRQSDGTVRVYHLAKKRSNLRSFARMDWAAFDVWIKKERHDRYERMKKRSDEKSLQQDEAAGMITESRRKNGTAVSSVRSKDIRSAAITERHALTAHDQDQRDDIFGIKKPEPIEEKQPAAAVIEEKKEKKPVQILPDVAPDDFETIFAAYGVSGDN